MLIKTIHSFISKSSERAFESGVGTGKALLVYHILAGPKTVFQVKTRKERVGRNPRNKAEYPIPSRKVVTFKIGKELKGFSAEDDGQEAVPAPIAQALPQISAEA